MEMNPSTSSTSTTTASPGTVQSSDSNSATVNQQHEVTVPVSNEFEMLGGGETDEMPTLTPNPIATVHPPTKKKVRVPPITVVNQTTRQLRELMTKLNIAQTEYNMKATKTGAQIFCTGEKGYQNTVKALQESNTQFHTYTPAAEQPVKVMLSGLTVYDVAELETELTALGVIPTEIKLFSRKVVGLEESALYLLHFAKGSVKLSELRKVKAVFNVIVNWRYFERRPTDAVQCHRYQRFGHGMRNCNLRALCVKRGEQHFSAECKLPKKADLVGVDRNATRQSIKCANCSGQHTANYRGCPSRKNYLEKLEQKRAERRNADRGTEPQHPSTQSRPNNSAAPSDGSSYAQMLKGQANDIGLFSMSEFLALAREMFNRLANCRTKQQQMLALFELTTKYVYNV